MIDFDFNQDCCGCQACASSCAHGAIRMQANDEGFLMPVVDREKCVDCGLCDKACPHLHTAADRTQFSLQSLRDCEASLYYSNDEERKDSASGGFVYDVFKKVLREGGAVAGCVWTDRLEAAHIVTDKMDDLHRLQGSKYVQSDMRGCFKEIRQLLREGRQVAFCGTPCQTAGLRQYLGKTDCSRLISICLICHGVPSPGVWELWKRLLVRKYGAELADVNMRDKSYKGYRTSYVRYSFPSQPVSEVAVATPHTSRLETRNVGLPTYLADPFIFLFTDNLFLRHSCHHCRYKAQQNGADIIVGDFYASTPGAGNMGCSSLLAMNDKGREAIHSLDGTVIPSDYVTVGSVNAMLWKSIKEHPRRGEFFERYKRGELEKMSAFTAFLPLRFYLKKVLNQLGLFGFCQSLLPKK